MGECVRDFCGNLRPGMALQESGTPLLEGFFWGLERCGGSAEERIEVIVRETQARIFHGLFERWNPGKDRARAQKYGFHGRHAEALVFGEIKKRP